MGNPGTWGPAEQSIAYGAVARATHMAGLDQVDNLNGDTNKVTTAAFATSTTSGTEAGRAQITATGLTASAWSDPVAGEGAARGLAFRNYVNNTSASITFKASAVLDGEFSRPWFPMGPGTLIAGAAIHVYDATKFAAALNGSGTTAAQYLLGGYQLVTAMDPSAAFQNLDTLLASALLGGGSSFLSNQAPYSNVTFGQPVEDTVSTNLITVAAQQVFTIVFDVATSATIGGDVYFLDTLAPATNFFTDSNGAPVSGISTSGPAPVIPPAVSSISLSPASATNFVKSPTTVTATVIGSDSNPVAGAIVKYTVTSGPNTGLTGGGQTDSNGLASFSYTGISGAGTDTVQASIGAVASNSVQSVWQRVTPTISWMKPADVTFGTALGNGQLDASSSVPGTFTYNPGAGTVLAVGANQSLSATFTPTDSVTYNVGNASTTINVNAGLRTAPQIIVTSALSRNGNITVQLTLANAGTSAAGNVTLTSVKIGSTSGTPVPLNLGTIGANSMAIATIAVPGSVGVSGAPGSLTITGTYDGGSFSTAARITLP